MKDPYIEIAYEIDGRVVEGQCSGLLRFVVSKLAKCRTKADEKTMRAYAEGLDKDEIEAVSVAAEKLMPASKRRVEETDDEDEATEVDEATDDSEEDEETEAVDEEDGSNDVPGTEDSDGNEKEEVTPDDPKDGWPNGIDVDQKGAYYDLHGSDGNRIVNSDSPSGKWQGENAAQEAAWKYENALTAEG